MIVENISTVILSLLLIQEGQLSVSGKRMCTILVNRLEDKACPVNVLFTLTASGVNGHVAFSIGCLTQTGLDNLKVHFNSGSTLLKVMYWSSAIFY